MKAPRFSAEPWMVDTVGNGLPWKSPSATRYAYVSAEGGIVAIVPPVSNPRCALKGGETISDEARCAEAFELRNAHARLFHAAPKLLAALSSMLEAYAPKAAETAKREGETALHPAVQAAREALALAGVSL